MNLRASRPLRRRLLGAALTALVLVGCGSSNNSSLAAQFTASGTASSPGLVKLIRKSTSGTRVVVQVVIYGPAPALDLYSFAFDVKIADTSVLKFVAGSGVAGGALTATGGQTIEAIVQTAPADASDVVCGVSKLGGGLGNGIAGAQAVVVEMAFDVKKEGTTTLTLIGSGANPPRALDHNGATIGAVTFDSASASVKGVSSGGGGY